ncbi:MAG: LytTR family DNA-binding domain-containing protein [Lachnospiraceae bacterium]|nr:LytTR family DNA-binding domain-containing protein [Lachnospiraceae bacterium]
MTYNIAICENDIPFIKRIKTRLSNLNLYKSEMKFYEFNSGFQLIDYLDSSTIIFDVLFLEVQLDGMDGYHTAKAFRQQFPDTVMIFCSGEMHPKERDFEVSPYRYLLKEYSDERLRFELEAVMERVQGERKSPVITAKGNSIELKIKTNEILYISKLKRGSCLHLHRNSKHFNAEIPIATKEHLDVLKQCLEQYGFARPHDSYLVNMKYMKSKLSTKTNLVMADGTELSVARAKAKNFQECYEAYCLKK